jgi:hypothetical protein
MHKLIALGIFIPIMMLTAPNAYAISIGFSRGEQQAAKDFQNHTPFNSACGKHTSYYCAGWVKGYTTKWNSLVQLDGLKDTLPSSNSTATISIHTVNTIQGSNSSILIQEEPGIRKAVLSNIDNAIFIAHGSVKSAIPVNVNAKIINQLTNSRVDTTQGIDMTKKIIATELTDAINTIAPNSISHSVNQPVRIAVDNQAICNGIASPTKASCSFTISLHS